MGQKLLIVESPAKAKTIEKFLGKDFVVKSSFGHVRDLDKGNNGIDIQNNFKPNYVVTPDKARVVKDLKDTMKKSDEVWLATDEDREGEAISWHLCEVLGLDPRTTKRIVFREITKSAIQSAVASPRNLDLDLVNAQQARRVLDRLVGFELSEVLWRKIKASLSAGRVQSVAVRLVVDREREITKFNVETFFKVKASFPVEMGNEKKTLLIAESDKRFAVESDAQAFLEKCIGTTYKVHNITVKPGSRKPAPPFTTSTLQQEASRKMGFGVKRTMIAAQRLYEAGLITYMRTDSTNLSETALSEIAQNIEQTFGAKYVETRRYKTKNDSAQEAHEAIRPSYIENKSIHNQDKDQEKLYELIWKRTIASQMANAILEKTDIDIAIAAHPGQFLRASGEVVKFDGFLRVYFESVDDEEDDTLDTLLPPVTVGQPLKLNEMTATQRFTKPAARYTEASLVKKMEELGIGRPSTYAPTISKIMEENRGYVVKESRDGVKRNYKLLTLKADKITGDVMSENTGASKNQLFPTDMGMLVTDFLNEHFDKVMDYHFTAEIEKEFDIIADGNLEWTKMISSFYNPFHQTVEETKENAARASGERVLGIDPASGRSILVRLSRYGKPIVQIGKIEELGEDEKPQYANLKPGQSLETIELEEAFALFALPMDLGEYEGLAVSVNIGRFGPYVKFGDAFVSLPKGEDAYSVDLDRAIEVIEAKRKSEAAVGMFEGKGITKGTGRFGPFIKWNDLYINVPRRYNLETISQAEMEELIEMKVNKEANRYIRQWESEKISIENGRWGPFIKFGKKMLKLGKNKDGQNFTDDQLANISLEEVMAIIETQEPGAFAKKAKAPAKKAPIKKAPAKKAPIKK
ncbi:type I DNA topoisomerase [Candidatus Brachybacter algidus]|uniref:type I DNA topoisomerase n=1 Tax=Candidatus Brachybacter algidus TaxID=2982024 RepID=UPI001DBF6B0F|nr:type I DNA topoisomerase [Candidatus Brachybacter algidus]MBK6450994.1 type I DNA topoisomerase [Candidatus Brachybacter algidus]